MKRMSAEQARKAAFSCARGCYQEGVVAGYETLSGAGLLGAARRWSGRYKRSREALLQRLREAHIPHAVVRGMHDRRFLVWGTWAVARAAELEVSWGRLRDLEAHYPEHDKALARTHRQLLRRQADRLLEVAPGRAEARRCQGIRDGVRAFFRREVRINFRWR